MMVNNNTNSILERIANALERLAPPNKKINNQLVIILISKFKSDKPNQHGHINNRNPIGLLNLINSK